MRCKYNNSCGYITSDISSQRYLSKRLLKMTSSNNEFKFIKPTWDDYIRDGGEEGQLLFNPEWQI